MNFSHEILEAYRGFAAIEKVAAAALASPGQETFAQRAGLAPHKEKPFPHQLDAAQFAMDRGGNAIFAHDTGTGKTRTATMVAQMLRKAHGAKSFAVVPAAVRKQFAESIGKWTDEKPYIVDSGDDPVPANGLPVISYELFKKKAPEFAAKGYQHVIFDEAHKAKDPQAGFYQSMKEHRPLFKSYNLMTASLTSTSPEDVVQLVDVMTGGDHELGSPGDFRRKYVVTRGDRAGVFGRRRMQRKASEEAVGFRNEKELGKILRKYVHHVGEEDIAGTGVDKPKKITQTVEVPMSEDQTKLYLYAMRRLPPEVRNRLKSDELSNTEISSLYNKLIQTRGLSGGLHTVAKGLPIEESARLTPKTQRVLSDLKQHLYETPDGRSIIISNLVHGGVDVLSAALKQNKIPFGVFMGKGEMSETERQAALAAHRAGKIKALVVSPAGFEGLDSPDTTMVQVYDGHFNPERILQGEARGIRAGGQKMRTPQDRRVMVRRYVSTFPQKSGLVASIGRAFGYQSREKHIDQRVWDRAQERHNVNKGLIDIIKNRKPEAHQL